MGVIDTLAATEDTAATYTAADLLGNDTDANGDALSIKSITAGSGGAVVLNDNGSVTFTPAANFNGAASFSYVATDGKGGDSAATTVTVNVAAVNDAPTGAVTITGTATEGQTLTANTSALADADTLGTLSYQWLREGSAITGATGSTYALGDADVGKKISIEVSYTDGNGTVEKVPSAQTAAVANVNDLPTGAVTISGTATEGQTLTANTSALADADGLGTLSYQWLREGVAITGATSSTYALGDADVAKKISVEVSYTDGNGTAEKVTSAQTAAVVNVNDAPTGDVTITGTVITGQTLTAANTLADADGLGTISYQWQSGGQNIASATANTYVLQATDVGKTITVVARYTDGQGTAESVTSAATAAVAPTFTATDTDGVITFGGTATGAISLVVNANGTATFTRQGVAATAVASISAKVIDTPDGASTFALTGTAGNDTLRFKVDDANTALTLTGNLDAGADRIVLVLPDDADNTQVLKFNSTATLNGTDDELIVAFSAADDEFTLVQGSVVNGYDTLQVRGGNLIDTSLATLTPQPQIVFVGTNDGGAGI